MSVTEGDRSNSAIADWIARPCRLFMEFGVCRWMVDCVRIVLFGVACGVGTGAVS